MIKHYKSIDNDFRSIAAANAGLNKEVKLMNKDTFQKVRFHLIAMLCLFFICGIFSSYIHAAAWTQVNRQPGGTFRAVVYADSRFVAVGDDGLVWTSGTGLAWTARNPGTTLGLYGITYGQSKYVVVGYHGVILTSSTGTTWTQRNPASAENLFGVAYNGTDLFVAVGYNGRIMTSPDAITWTDQSRFSASKHYAISWGNGRYVVSSDTGRIYTSTDGVNWALASANTGTNNPSVVYGSGLFVVGGHGIVYTSPDGNTWTKRDPDTTNYFHGLTYTGSDYIGCGNSDGYGCSMIQVSSTTATGSWVRDRTPDYSVLTSIASSPTRVIAVGARKLIITNTVDGVGDGAGCGVIIAKSIKVIAPNGGENLDIGATYTIKWSSTDVTDPVRIRYSKDNGANWTMIADSIPNSGSYDWTVPDTKSAQCLVRINAVNVDGAPFDVSDNTFSIGGVVPTITITAPNGGETLSGGTSYTIRWQSSITFDKVDIEYYNGSQWVVIKNGAPDVGTYSWSVPNLSTNAAKIWMKGWSSMGNNTDYSDDTFSITPPLNGSITVTSPKGGEVWAKNSTENITWTSSGQVGNVAIFYSTNNGFNWTTIASSTANDGSYSWKLPDIIAYQCLVKVRDTAVPQISDVSNSVFSIGGSSQIVLNKTRFNFGYIKNGASPCPQNLFIYNGGGGTLNWTAGADASWINLSHTSGSGGGTVAITLNTIGLSTGSYVGTITVSDPSVGNSPQTAQVYLTVKNSNQDQVPFGTFATPEDGLANVTGSIAVTGWALDDTCVESVKIYRQVNGGLSFIGDAVFVEGARPDVEQAYPDYPSNYRAGWGYMMLTNFLPDGLLVLKAIATDNTGHQVVLGTKTITVDNAHAVKPFGAIDSPDQGGNASGSKFRNNGWALTPQPNKIPENGSTIKVWIDGVFVDNVTYNLYRSDIADYFPDYANAKGSWGYLDFDTTAYANGVHTISWSVTDNVGNTDGIGSRYFSIQNTGGVSSSSAAEQNPGRLPTGPMLSPHLRSSIPMDLSFDYPIKVKTGYGKNINPQMVYSNEEGIFLYEIKELERIEIQLDKNISHGYLVVGNEFRSLPIGSSLTPGKGIFSWLPGPGFLGHYKLLFVGNKETGEPFMMKVHLNIHPDTPGNIGNYKRTNNLQ